MAKRKRKMDVQKFLTRGFGYMSGAYTGAQAQTFAEQNFLPEQAIPYSGGVPVILGGATAWFAPEDWKTLGWGALAYGGFSLINQVVLNMTEAGGGGDTSAQGRFRRNRSTSVGMRAKPAGHSEYKSDAGATIRK